jgi:hypothetical protein
MAKKNAIAAEKDEECAAADEMGPEMAGDEEDAEKEKEEKPEKPPASKKSKSKKTGSAKGGEDKEDEDDEDEDEDEEDDEDEDEDEEDNGEEDDEKDKDGEADAQDEGTEKPAKPPRHEKITERHEKITERKAQSAAADLKEIATLCRIAGRPELAAEFITTGLSVKDVQKKLVDLRAEGSSQHQISNRVATNATKSMDALIASATQEAKRSGNSPAVAVARAIEANPEVYAAYKQTLPHFRPSK